MASAIRPKCDEIRTGRVMGSAGAAEQIAGTVIHALITKGLLDPEIMPWWQDDAPPSQAFAIPKDQIPKMARDYVNALEIERTNKWCRCEWIVHPDDLDKTKGRRMRRGDTHPQCAVHTKEGFIMGFFEWLFAEPTPVQFAERVDPVPAAAPPTMERLLCGHVAHKQTGYCVATIGQCANSYEIQDTNG